MLRVEYGIPNAYTDVTRRALIYHYLMNKRTPSILYLPASDEERTCIFQDPLEGVLKEIRIHYNGMIQRFQIGSPIQLDITERVEEVNKIIRTLFESMEADTKLNYLHRWIQLSYGTMKDELIEQYMACMFITPDDVVLEIGSNIGRNSLVISCLLSQPDHLVTLETDPISCKQLLYNSIQNRILFHIENAALFKESPNRLLLQKNESWDTIVSDRTLDGYTQVRTITWENLLIKYNKTFTTLVADCEGALYYILQDFPTILDTFTTLIMENDYHEESHKREVDRILLAQGFRCVYRKSGGWGPCMDRFYETWKR